MVLEMILKSHVEQNECNWLYQKKFPQNLNEYLLSEKEKTTTSWYNEELN